MRDTAVRLKADPNAERTSAFFLPKSTPAARTSRYHVASTILPHFMVGHFIKKIETVTGPHACLILDQMKHAQAWHSTVQPGIALVPGRIDGAWDWPWIYRMTTQIERLRGRKVAFLQIAFRLNQTAIPVGQVLLSNGSPFIKDASKKSIFLWYLTSAPRQTITYHGLPAPKSVMGFLIDLAIQFSYMHGYEGRIWLHCAKAGGQGLMNRYIQAGLTHHPKSARIAGFRRNDGRYFYADEKLAIALSSKLDYLR